MLAVTAIAIGAAIALLGGLSLRPLSDLRLRLVWVMLVLFVVQAVARGRLLGFGEAWQMGGITWVLSSVGLLGCLAANFRTPGMPLLVAGILLNVDAVLLNAAMPVSPVAVESLATQSLQPSFALSQGFYQVAGGGTIALVLGDIMPLPGLSAVVSVGDVLLGCGVVVVVVSTCLRGTPAKAI